MSQVIKETTDSDTSHFDASIVSEEIVNSGNYNDAQKILQKVYKTGDVLAEQFYRLGNRFFNVNQKQAAEMAWQKADNLSVYREYAKPSEPVSLNLKRLRLQTVGSILIVVASFYVIIFVLFERELELFQFTKIHSSTGEFSYWDEWWDTGRPVKNYFCRLYSSYNFHQTISQPGFFHTNVGCI